MMLLLAGFILVVGIGLLPVGPALVMGVVVGHDDTYRIVTVPLPAAPAMAPAEDCDCGVPSSPRGPR